MKPMPANGNAPDGPLDWRVIADRRLATLVELEHDHSILLDRLGALQTDHQRLLALSRRLPELERNLKALTRERDALAAALARSQGEYAVVVGSRSWRVTRPLRRLSVQRMRARQRFKQGLRALLAIGVVRRLAHVLARCMPGLHQRVRTALYPPR